MILDARLLNRGGVSLPDASNWPVKVALRGKDKSALGILRAALEALEHIFGHRDFPARSFRFAKRIEDRLFSEVQILDPDSEDFLGTQTSVQDDLGDVPQRLASFGKGKILQQSKKLTTILRYSGGMRLSLWGLVPLFFLPYMTGSGLRAT